MTFLKRSHSSRRLKVTAIFAASSMAFLSIGQAPVASARPVLGSGFEQPFVGPVKYLKTTPTQATRTAQVNKPLGQAKADRLAKQLGFDKSKSFSKAQYALYLSGKGVGGGGADAKTAADFTKESVLALTNSNAAPYFRNIDGVRTRIVLGSYGLYVNPEGLLESPANNTSPVKKINYVLEPQALCRKSPPPAELNLPEGTCGYMGRWMKKNGAADTLKELYASAYAVELGPGADSQALQEPHELVPNVKKDVKTWVGMPIAPSIYIVNFLLIYALSPREAAKMPAYWEPIPEAVATSIIGDANDQDGQVPYSQFKDLFTR